MSLAHDQKPVSVESYIRKLAGQEKEVLNIDHNYVKSWSSHPDSLRIKPTRFLFMKGTYKYAQPPDISNTDEDIDIETYKDVGTSPFDTQKSKLFPSECEKILKGTLLYRELDDENEIDMSSMNSEQQKLYRKIVNILQEDRLARLSFCGAVNEPLKKRIILDKTAGRIRVTFSSIFWDLDLLSWLHRTLLTTADISILSVYVEVLQILKFKVPALIDRVLQSCAGSSEGDAVLQFMRKPADPVLPILNQNKPKKLPGNPIILVCPNGPKLQTSGSHSQRLRFWQNNLSAMCKVMSITLPPEDLNKITTIDRCLDLIMTSVRNKVTEVKNHYPNRPVILLGWMIGALVACHIALQEQVDAVICLGFPLTGVNGSRGGLSDPLLNCKVPTLFIVGQNALTCSMDNIEDFRARMRANTGLVMLGGADDMLRVNPTKMSLTCVTQHIVDRCLFEEIGEFLTSVFVQLPSTSTASSNVLSKVCTPIMEEEPEPSHDEEWKPEEDGKRRRRKPREYSPEVSPVRKRSKQHIPRQVTFTSKPPHISSESTSSELEAKERRSPKHVSKLPEKRVGRPPGPSWRKRIKIKPIKDPKKETKRLRKAARLAEQEAYSPSKTAGPKPLPFSKSILPKKDDSVDVDKAFGCDSSFLPRPLSPPEPEDTVSAEETEKVMAELEALEKAAAQSAADGNAPTTNSASQSVSDRAFHPISNDLKESQTEKPLDGSDIGEDLPPISETKTSPPTALLTTMQGVLSKNASLLSPFQSLKSKKTINLVVTTASGSTSATKSTIITVPSATAASLLASSPALKGPSNRVIQLLTKGTTFTTTKPAMAFSPVASVRSETPNREPCNLSLLSDVAGMTEPMSEPSKKLSTNTATLVKLTTPTDRSNPQILPVKCIKVVKKVNAPVPPVRAETTEEMVEKHLAIQALNKSIGIDSPSTPTKEPGYTVCYAKPDGSIISHSVSKSSVPSYLTRPGIALFRGGAQGRGRPPLTSKSYKFLNMQ